MNKRQEIILNVLDSFGGEASVLSLADRMGLSTCDTGGLQGSLKCLEGLGHVKRIRGSGRDSTWRLVERFGVTEDD